MMQRNSPPIRDSGSVFIDEAGLLQAADDNASAFLGINDFKSVPFKSLFVETALTAMIQAGEITSCHATTILTKREVEMVAVSMVSDRGNALLITLTSRSKTPGAGSFTLVDDTSSGCSSNQSIIDSVDPSFPRNAVDLADFSPHGLLLLSPKFDFLAANTAFFEMTHLVPADVQGRGWLAALPMEESQILARALTDVDWEDSERIERECRLVSPLGDLLWVRLTGQRIVANGTDEDAPGTRGDTYNYVLTFDDIDQRKQSDDRNFRLANYDSLTGLPNRRDFEQVLTECIQERTVMRSILAVLFIDLDGFKQVNDIYGHEVGDQLLKKMAVTIRDAGSRAKKVARLGGDEFTVFLTDVKRIEEVKHFAARLNVLLQDSLSVKGVETNVSASIGIAMHHKLVDDRRGADRIVNDLLRHADEAMYAAKSSGKNCYVFYGNYAKDATQSRSLQSTDNMIREVSKAIKHNELFVEYQPQVTTACGNINSCEALVRWNHPREGVIGPAAFVPLVESNGSMAELTIWLIQRICKDVCSALTTRQQTARGGKPLSISVNLSPAQIQDKEILEALDQIITSESLPTDRFLFEITERTLIADPVAGHSGIDWLRQRGYRVALDDFGTGYSSLAYLHRFPLDEIKLDGSFICDVETRQASRTVVNSVVELAHALGIRVTAEGVEHESQLRYLSKIGCDQWQGYLMSPAVAPAAFLSLMREHASKGGADLSSLNDERSSAKAGLETKRLAQIH